MDAEQVTSQFVDTAKSFAEQYAGTLVGMTMDELANLKSLLQSGQTYEALEKVYAAMTNDELDASVAATTQAMHDLNKEAAERKKKLDSLSGSFVGALLGLLIDVVSAGVAL